MTRIVELIYTEEKTGTGAPDDAIRLMARLHTKDGKLVAETDAYEDRNPARKMSIRFYPEHLKNKDYI